MTAGRVVCAACALFGVLALPGCGDAREGYASVPGAGGEELAGPARTDVRIEMTEIDFEPRQVKLARGATVTWTNRDRVAHDVTQGTVVYSEFTSPDVEPGQTYRHTFDEPGEVHYRCTIHANMEGKLRVK